MFFIRILPFWSDIVSFVDSLLVDISVLTNRY